MHSYHNQYLHFCGKGMQESEKKSKFMLISKAEKQKGCSMYRNLSALKNTKLYQMKKKASCLHNM